MNRHLNLIIFIGALITSVIGNNVWAAQDVNLGPTVPTAKITLTHDENNHIVSISSKDSIDNLNSGMDIVWTVYSINSKPDQEAESDQADFDYQLLGNIKTDEELNAGINYAKQNLPGGYNVILTVTNKDGVSHSAEELIIIKSSDGKWLFGVAKKATKIVVRKLGKFLYKYAKDLARDLAEEAAYNVVNDLAYELGLSYSDVEPSWSERRVFDVLSSILSYSQKKTLLYNIRNVFLPKINHMLELDEIAKDMIEEILTDAFVETGIREYYAEKGAYWITKLVW